jgi:hypothetical protein
MDAQNTPSQTVGQPPEHTFRRSLANAAHFWEPRRLVYNALLAATALFWLVKTWPHFRPVRSEPLALLKLAVLALLANVCYCAAYLADIPMQQSTARLVWNRYRWILFALGSIFAMVFETYWILDEIFPDFT